MEAEAGRPDSADRVRDVATTGGSDIPPAPSGPRVLREGVVAGVCGYIAVVLVVTIVDVLSGRAALHTASHLGAWLFHPVEDALTGPGWPSAIAYNGLHLVVSLFVGIVAATMVAFSERMTGFWYVALMVLIALAIYTVGVLGAIAVEFKAITDWPTAVLGTGAWLTGITVYLRFAHPRLMGQMREESAGQGA
jgi:hypothetical protein